MSDDLFGQQGKKNGEQVQRSTPRGDCPRGGVTGEGGNPNIKGGARGGNFPEGSANRGSGLVGEGPSR